MTIAAPTSTLHFLPIPQAIADEVRRTLTDGFGHRLRVSVERAPCRLCLRISTTAEELILLSYQPLPGDGPYAEVGPIFIHASPCRAYANLEQFPEDFTTRALVLRAYGREGQIVDAVVAQPGDAQEAAQTFLRDAAIAEVHARHTSYTCYDFKIVRKT